MKKIVSIVIAGLAIIATVPMFAAFEAHIINVTATIENALFVDPMEIDFGTVFPQEYFEKFFKITFSKSFSEQGRSQVVDYKIVQKPKCKLNDLGSELPLYAQVGENESGDFICPDHYGLMKSLCRFLSKEPNYLSDTNDFGVSGYFYASPDGNYCQIPEREIAIGQLNSQQDDIIDNWKVDFKVPPIAGNIGQDWPQTCRDIGYIIGEPGDYGCDLWLEVTGIRSYGSICLPKPENCFNSFDDDCDGLADCEDSDCDNEPTCPLKIRLENKDEHSNNIEDDTYGILTFFPSRPAFDFSFKGYGLAPNTGYYLIYFAEPWPGNHPGASLGYGVSNSSGGINMQNSRNLNMNLPHADDANFGSGAKIWLVPAADYDDANRSMKNQPQTLFLQDTQLINYTDTDINLTPGNLVSLGNTNQYGYNHEYAFANANFNFQNPFPGRLNGTLVATNLKPFATYQVKLEGKPTCLYGLGGNDATNETLGYNGRWWNNTTNANVDDAYYNLHHDTECIIGYLVWDFFTADAAGAADPDLTSRNSYHVLWCGGPTCNTANNNFLNQPDITHPTVKFCPAGQVNGQLERGTCGGLNLPAGDYEAKLVLTEESFHLGPWAGVMGGDINFTIN